MGHKKSFVEHIVANADLQDEPIPGLPLIEIAGDRRVLIENHRGVVEYGTQTIRVNVKFGQVCICGNGLELARMTRGQLVVCGYVEAVHLNRGRY